MTAGQIVRAIWGKMRAVRALSMLLLALALFGCGGVTPPPPEPPTVTRAQPPTEIPPLPAATSEPQALRGLDALDLDGREKALFWQLLSQLYSPCPSEAVSIRQCIEETRPCTACTPAAALLGAKIKDGATADQARELYSARFGPNIKQIDVADSPTRGPEDAPVTIMVWSDFECPHCKRALPVVESVFEKYAPKVRIVHKFYPLTQHAHARAAARAAIAAQRQGRYWEMERVLFDHQDEQSDRDLARYAGDLKLDMKRFAADAASERTTQTLERDHADADRAGLTGTPFVLVNGRELTGAFHIDPDLDAWVSLEIEMLSKR
jgi:protein-disulfide isomerase